MRPSADLARNGHSSESVSPRTTLRPVSPDQTNAGPLKRVRVGYDHYSPTTGTRSPMPPMAPTSDAARSSLLWRQPESLPRIHEDVLCRAWQPDPYVSDPQFVASTITSPPPRSHGCRGPALPP